MIRVACLTLALIESAAFAQPAAGPTISKEEFANIFLGNHGERRTVDGTLVDVDCYTIRGGFGPEHLRCSRRCAERGLPLALLDASGAMYIIMNRIHSPFTVVNRKLSGMLERTVRITGDFIDGNDIKVVILEKIEKSPITLSTAEIRARAKPRTN
jgi:hypothetical protein